MANTNKRGRKPDQYEDQAGARQNVAWLRRRYRTWQDVENATGISRGTLSAIHNGRPASRQVGEKLEAVVARLQEAQEARSNRRRNLRERWARPMVPREQVEALKERGKTVRSVVEEYLGEERK